ncbi:MAG: DNA alkylation repair protein [Rikenellaceae bacterium]|nr:DNA alkylation repair protein [Rikenellaceae bacterium]
MNEILSDIRKALQDNANESTKSVSLKFFKKDEKNSISLYGVKTSDTHKISKSFCTRLKDRDKNDIYGLCTELWRSGMLEETFVDCNISDFFQDRFEPEDFYIFESWVKDYVNNWASCDTLCNHTMGDFIQKYPEFLPDIKRWALSENKWMRRSSAVTFIIPARKGLYIDDVFEIAESLLLDKDDIVQKGYGWMLKAASQYCPEKVFDFIMQKKHIMPRTALRYAIEKLTPEMRKKAMKK